MATPVVSGSAIPAPAKTDQKWFLGLAFGLFWLVPVGLVLAIIATVVAFRRGKLRAWSVVALVLNGLVVAAICILLAIGFFLFSIFGGGAHANEAQAVVKPLQTALEQDGGHMICDYGDSGYGLDNTQPWYDAYYQAQYSPNLLNDIQQAAAQEGYALAADTSAQQKLDDAAAHTYPAREGYNSQSTYLISRQSGRELSVSIIHNGPLTLDCQGNGVTYGEQRTASGSDVLVKVAATFPDRTQ